MFVVRKRGYGGDFFIRWEKSSFLGYAGVGTAAQPLILWAIVFCCCFSVGGDNIRAAQQNEVECILAQNTICKITYFFFIFDSDSSFFCGIQKKISIFKQLRKLVVIRPWQPWEAQINHFDPVWSSLFMIGIRLITGSVFLTNIHTTCTHKIPFTFIPCFPLWYLFTISICLFVSFCFLIFQFQLQIFCTFQ